MPRPVTFAIDAEAGTIRCRVCGHVSHQPGCVAMLFCEQCQVFHEILTLELSWGVVQRRFALAFALLCLLNFVGFLYNVWVGSWVWIACVPAMVVGWNDTKKSWATWVKARSILRSLKQ